MRGLFFDGGEIERAVRFEWCVGGGDEAGEFWE
jgi:hypothetical protein